MPWRNLYLGKTYTQEKLVPWKNLHPGKTCTLQKLAPWENSYPGKTCTLEKLLPWKNLYPEKTWTLEKILPWKNFYPGKLVPWKNLYNQLFSVQVFPGYNLYPRKTKKNSTGNNSDHFHWNITSGSQKKPWVKRLTEPWFEIFPTPDIQHRCSPGLIITYWSSGFQTSSSSC